MLVTKRNDKSWIKQESLEELFSPKNILKNNWLVIPDFYLDLF